MQSCNSPYAKRADFGIRQRLCKACRNVKSVAPRSVILSGYTQLTFAALQDCSTRLAERDAQARSPVDQGLRSACLACVLLRVGLSTQPHELDFLDSQNDVRYLARAREHRVSRFTALAPR